MRLAPFVAPAAAAVLLFAGTGCVVTGTTYEIKAKEADSLREAMASLNREKGKLAEENASLAKQVAACRESEASLAARLSERNEAVKRLTEELGAARQMYEGSRGTREQFIDELLDKEKATGKRLQELSARAERDELELERLKKEMAGRDRETAELRKKLEIAVPDAESARRERDILAGRVERLQEERREAAARRDERLTTLAASLSRLSREVSVTPMGQALRATVPEKLVAKDRAGSLTELGSALVSLMASAAVDLPSSSLVIVAGGKATAEALRQAAAGDKAPEDRLFSHVREREPRAEFLLIAP